MKATKGKTKPGQFRVAAIGENKCTLESYNRRDFYKISLVTAGGPPCQLRYGSLEPIVVDRPALVLLNPLVPHSWTVPERTEPTEGYFCVFDEAFTNAGAPLKALTNRLFTAQRSPVYFPDEVQLHFLHALFVRMRALADTDYTGKDDLFRSQLNLVFHETIGMSPAEETSQDRPSAIAAAFAGLLRGQFPVDLPLQPIQLKKASDFADRLAIHVNHLNTAVHKATGQSTTWHINEQLITEAKSLLGYTGYNIAEIAYGLGFEYQSYFNRFFKKHAGLTPSDFRKNFEKYK
ncbi:helix-turn-helix domain-containing protein [Taibaiella chishuiensis]|uniref:AraC-like DNA-binding protein n=1 Tax=Taibaiella chishuiensis TaxID=1434707 RepID=A0A2P8D8J3_9BACT|nr:AraC family transcriptional regulator [Taibaiella chishuiensis]PSK93533.1 AraC-like DNA-binding protein [Taibaiella chishuiensis]